MKASERIVCCVSLVRPLGWARSASEIDQKMLESLVAVYGIWERTCFRHGGIQKAFTTVRPARLQDCAELIPN